MINKKEIEAEKEQINSLSLLVQTYEEIAAMRMRKTRAGILVSRDFVRELRLVYQALRSSYRTQILAIMKKRKLVSNSLLLIERKKKNVAVFLSSNTGLYGDILQKTYSKFIEFLNGHTSDIVIVGRFGESLFKQDYPTKLYTSFPLSDTNLQSTDMKNLVNFLLQYENVYLFYGQFESVGSQRPLLLDMYGDQMTPETTTDDGTAQVRYLFEPSLEKILEFFEQEIFATITEQVFHESDLAKQASRMITLDSAIENIKKRMKHVDLQSRLLTHRIQNKKQAEALSSMSLWKLT